jgi:PilZ domain
MGSNKVTKDDRFGIVTFERRAHPRLTIDLTFEYWRVGNSKSSPCEAENISENGLLLLLREEIKIGQKLRLSLIIDWGSDYLIIEPFVEVVWRDMKLKEGSYRVGVKIVEISPIEKLILMNFLGAQGDVTWRRGTSIPPKLLTDLGMIICNGKETDPRLS